MRRSAMLTVTFLGSLFATGMSHLKACRIHADLSFFQ